MSSSVISMPSATDFINRAFQSCKPLQWAREVLKNAIESGAKKIEFGVEWQGVKKDKVYRRIICDDGVGMSAKELIKYFRSIGQSGDKKIKSENCMDTAIHSNFGIGCRVSLLPINRNGLVYISYQQGKGAMIQMMYDNETGEYVVHDYEIENEDGEKEVAWVVDPEEIAWGQHEVDWSKVAPDWVKDHGTCIILMGNDENPDTFMYADPDGSKSNKALTKYINTRFLDLSSVEVRVIEFNFSDRESWPKRESEMHVAIPGKNNTQYCTTRTCHGALYYLTKVVPLKPKVGQLKASGIVSIEDDRVKIKWHLWEGDQPQCDGYASDFGYIAVQYGDELYEMKTHINSFRSFGIFDKDVKNRITLIIEPKLYKQDSQWGVLPNQSRSGLEFSGYGEKVMPIPFDRWGNSFLCNMPEEVAQVIKKAQAPDDLKISISEDFLKKLLSKVNERLKRMMLIADPKKTSKQLGAMDRDDVKVEVYLDEKGKIDKTGEGTTVKLPIKAAIVDSYTDPDSDPNPYQITERVVVHKTYESEPGRTRTRSRVLARKVTPGSKGSTPAIDAKVHGVPIPLFVGASKMDEPYNICRYEENYSDFDDKHVGPAILINTEADMLVESIKYYQGFHHPSHHESIRSDVLKAYASIACCKVTHALKFPKVNKDAIVSTYLSEAALTTAMLGYLAEDAYIAPRLGKYGHRAAKDEFEGV